jgi:hypothetical protein
MNTAATGFSVKMSLRSPRSSDDSAGVQIFAR